MHAITAEKGLFDYATRPVRPRASSHNYVTKRAKGLHRPQAHPRLVMTSSSTKAPAWTLCSPAPRCQRVADLSLNRGEGGQNP